jgi:hypothetical protein
MAGANFNMNPIGMKVEALHGTIAQQAQELRSLQYIVCLLIYKFGNPIVITERDARETPSGTLQIHTDAVTQSITITFKEVK